MRAIDIITKKRNGYALSKQEIAFIIEGYVNKEIPDYQVSAFLMAVYFQSMNEEEMCELTRCMISSGEGLDFSGISSFPVDKHSTGGVGDKVSIILAPMVAACGATVPMMSGRSLGHTGGTLDKLESIAGYQTRLNKEQIEKGLRENGYVMMGQTANFVPADRKLYALRDVTATVESIPLIVSSILSKKTAEGARALVMDVKCGSGAFCKTMEEAAKLADALRMTGRELERRVITVISNMDSPLGYMVGNFLEIEECVHCLRVQNHSQLEDHRSDDLQKLTFRLGSWMLQAAGIVSGLEEGEERCRQAIESGEAWKHFCNNVALQGGDIDQLCSEIGTRRSKKYKDIQAARDGYINIEAFDIGLAVIHLGGGRKTHDASIDPDVGVELLRKNGKVHKGESVLRLWYDESKSDINESYILAEGAIRISTEPIQTELILQEQF